MKAPRRTVYVVDDDASVRKSVGRLLRTAGYQVETFASADEFLAHLPRTSPPVSSSISRCRAGTDSSSGRPAGGAPAHPHRLRHRPRRRRHQRARHEGAARSIPTKPYSPEDLLEAVQRAMARTSGIGASGPSSPSWRTAPRHSLAREADVLRLVVRGLLNKQVAAELGISEKTVKVHRARVMHKMRADSMADLVRMAGRLHLAPGTE